MTPDEMRQAIERAVVDTLRSIHHDGTGCGTNGSGGCSVCYGPSPLDATEIAEHLVPAIVDAVAPALNRLTALETMLVPVLRQERNEAEAERDALRAAVERVRALCDASTPGRLFTVRVIRAALDGPESGGWGTSTWEEA